MDSDCPDDIEESEPVDEPVEQDTADTEDIINLMEVLLPNGAFPPSASQFGLHYNIKMFQGWVKQPSACCAAASVAGAWNCLADVTRRNDRSLDHIDILNVYRAIMANSIDKKKKSFERCLGASIDELLGHLVVEFVPRDPVLGKKGPACTKSAVTKAVKSLIDDYQRLKENPITSGESGDGSSSSTEPRAVSALQLLCELIDSEAPDAESDSLMLTASGENADNVISIRRFFNARLFMLIFVCARMAMRMVQLEKTCPRPPHPWLAKESSKYWCTTHGTGKRLCTTLSRSCWGYGNYPIPLNPLPRLLETGAFFLVCSMWWR
jgi:hypothetical protein